eukprot:1154344-Pelagomonas_calceolata.AAC.7
MPLNGLLQLLLQDSLQTGATMPFLTLASKATLAWWLLHGDTSARWYFCTLTLLHDDTVAWWHLLQDGASKEGAGRVALFRETGLTHLYTVEANYNTARVLNLIPAASGKHNGRASPPNTRRISPRFTADVLQAGGRAFLVSLGSQRNNALLQQCASVRVRVCVCVEEACGQRVCCEALFDDRANSSANACRRV